MEYEKYQTLTPVRNIFGREEKYVVNEFKRIEHQGQLYLAQGYKYLYSQDVKWCRAGTYSEKTINNIMKLNFCEKHFILDGVLYEL